MGSVLGLVLVSVASLDTRFGRLRGYARTVMLRFGWIHEALRVRAPLSVLWLTLHEGIRWWAG